LSAAIAGMSAYAVPAYPTYVIEYANSGSASSNVATGSGAVDSGDNNVASGTGAVAIGESNSATGTGAVALGNASSATGDGSVAIGNATLANANGVAIGNGASNGIFTNSVAIGAGSVNTADNQVALGGQTIDTARTVTGVAAGTLSANSFDAVNGSQLYETNQNVAANSSAIGTLNTQVTGLHDDVTRLGDAIERLDSSGRAGTATAIALTGNAFLPDQKFNLTGNVATYRGAYAAALQIGALISPNVAVNAGVSTGLNARQGVNAINFR
jgi:autotransporter adhesin